MRRLYTNISNNIANLIFMFNEGHKSSDVNIDYECLAVLSDINIIVGGIKTKINKVLD